MIDELPRAFSRVGLGRICLRSSLELSVPSLDDGDFRLINVGSESCIGGVHPIFFWFALLPEKKELNGTVLV